MSTEKTSTQSATPPPGKDYGYVRKSTRHQKEDRQILALLEQGISRRNIFVDAISGGTFEREKYLKLLARLKPGDCLFVKELDRFGRNYDEILENWRVITKEKCADVVVLDMLPLLDTRQRFTGLTGRFISDLVLGLLSYCAEKERQLNHQRQAEGIAAAKAKGVKFGRPPKERTARFEEMAQLWQGGEISGRAAAKTLGIAPITFKDWASEYLRAALR